MFGHLGIECNLLDIDERERVRLHEIVALHKRYRPLLHAADTIRVDHPDPSLVIHGAYAPDRSEALVSIAKVAAGHFTHGTLITIPDLIPSAVYRVSRQPLFSGDVPRGPVRRQPLWMQQEVSLSGTALANHGVMAPVLWPEQAVLVHLVSE